MLLEEAWWDCWIFALFYVMTPAKRNNASRLTDRQPFGLPLENTSVDTGDISSLPLFILPGDESRRAGRIKLLTAKKKGILPTVHRFASGQR